MPLTNFWARRVAGAHRHCRQFYRARDNAAHGPEVSPNGQNIGLQGITLEQALGFHLPPRRIGPLILLVVTVCVFQCVFVVGEFLGQWH